jgi:dipeptidyl aminopeptidase/acylaminoacyl peptidase
LIGWSEGTILATKIAEERKDVVGLVLMGVVGSSFKELLRHFFLSEKEFLETIYSIENMPDDQMLGIDRPAIRVKELFKDEPNSERILKLTQPILVLHGDIDVETPVEQAYLVKKAIEKNNNAKSKVIIYKGLGHGFAPHLGINGEIKTEGPFDKKVLNDLCDWIDKCFK